MNRFYKVIHFLDKEIHFFDYLFYILIVAFAFYLYEYYDFPVKILESIIVMTLALAFSNTWCIQARKDKEKQ